MSNPLYQMLGGMQNNGMGNILQRIQQFKNNFHGDPRQQVEQMLASGRITQQQYDNAVRQAQQIMKLINR